MELMEENGKLDFDAFYKSVVNRLSELGPDTGKDDVRERVSYERFLLNKVRELLEYIEDREHYYGIAYKDDVMAYAAARVAETGFRLVTIFAHDELKIMDILYRKDKSIAANRKKAAG